LIFCFCFLEDTIDGETAYGAAMADILSRIYCGGCQKNLHAIPPWRRHLTALSPPDQPAINNR